MEDGGLKDVGMSSKSDTDIPKTSDASNDAIHADDFSPVDDLRSDDLRDLKISHNSDDTSREDCNFSNTSNEKLDHSEEKPEANVVDSTKVIDKKVPDLDATVAEKTLLKSSANEDVVVIDIKEEQDKNSTVSDEAKTDTGSVFQIDCSELDLFVSVLFVISGRHCNC